MHLLLVGLANCGCNELSIEGHGGHLLSRRDQSRRVCNSDQELDSLFSSKAYSCYSQVPAIDENIPSCMQLQDLRWTDRAVVPSLIGHYTHAGEEVPPRDHVGTFLV